MRKSRRIPTPPKAGADNPDEAECCQNEDAGGRGTKLEDRRRIRNEKRIQNRFDSRIFE
jgi:hypothetical protein